jgi:hypothetical protein
MVKGDTISRIQTELTALKIEEVTLNHKYKNTYHFGEGTFEPLPEIERVRKRKVELEDALRVIEEFE